MEFDELKHQLRESQDDFSQRSKEAQQTVVQQHERDLSDAMNRDRPLRLVGALLLAAGLACGSFANFV